MRFKHIFNLLFLYILIIASNNAFAQSSGIKEIVKSQQERIISLENTLKTLIGNLENPGQVNLDKNNLETLVDKVKILNSKLDMLTEFSYRLEFEIKRIQTHLNLNNSIIKDSNNLKNSKKDLTEDITKNKKLSNNKSEIKKEGLDSKSEGVLGYINEKEVDKTERSSDVQKFFKTSDPEQQYKISLDYATKGEYKKAEKAFQSFIELNKNHNRTKDAQYWLGRVYFTQKKYEESAIALADFNSLYPDDKRFEETTLLIAESASNFAPKKQLCEILNQSLEFMPNPSKKFTDRIGELLSFHKCPD